MPRKKELFNAEMAKMIARNNSDFEYQTERKKIFADIEKAALQGKYYYRYEKTIMPEIIKELSDLGFFVREDLIEWHGKE